MKLSNDESLADTTKTYKRSVRELGEAWHYLPWAEEPHQAHDTADIIVMIAGGVAAVALVTMILMGWL